MAIITISRLTGSGGREVATATADAMGFQVIDRDAAGAAPLHNAVVLGGGGQFLFASVVDSLHVQIVAPMSHRIARIMRFAQVDREGAERIIGERDEAKRALVTRQYASDWRDPVHYDLVLNLGKFSNDVAVKIIIESARTKGIEVCSADSQPHLMEEILNARRNVAGLADLDPESGKLPDFAHSSEREFARVMDFYRIRWQYEPKTFPIEWDENRNVQAAFTPDFYLPDLDLYIELTTMKQSLVTKKNRKVRRLRELHPDVNIKILYERDYQNLIWKYGLSVPDVEENGRKTG